MLRRRFLQLLLAVAFATALFLLYSGNFVASFDRPVPVSVAAAPPVLSAAQVAELRAYPFIDFPLLFRTTPLKSRPRTAFHPLRSASNKHVDIIGTVAPQLHAIASSANQSRAPPIVMANEEGTATPLVLVDAQYDAAFIINAERCQTNLWHGMVEVALPLLAMKALRALRELGHDARAAARSSNVSLFTPALADAVVAQLRRTVDSKSHILIARAPKKNTWGIANGGCPTLNNYPYGLSPESVAGWFIVALFDETSFGAKDMKPRLLHGSTDPRNVVFFGEWKPATQRRVVGAARPPAEFRLFNQHLEAAVTGSVGFGAPEVCHFSQDGLPPLRERPYYLAAAPFCPWVYDVFGKFALALATRAPLESPKTAPEFEHAVTAEELRCPRVLLVTRPRHHNGRAIHNEIQLLRELRALVTSGGPQDGSGGRRLFLPGCGSVRRIDFETPHMTVGRQILAAHNATILVGARGMGLANTIYMRRHAGLLVLSGIEASAALSFRDDNYPWNPFPVIRPSMPTVLGRCPVVFPVLDKIPRNDSEMRKYATRCLRRTINFCDIHCKLDETLGHFRLLVQLMHRSLARAEAATGSGDGGGGGDPSAVYHAKGIPLEEYFVIAEHAREAAPAQARRA